MSFNSLNRLFMANLSLSSVNTIYNESNILNTGLKDGLIIMTRFVYANGANCAEPEFDEFLRYGRLEHGFSLVFCGDCRHEKLVVFSCKRHGVSPSCGSGRMAESKALLVDDVFCSCRVR